MHSGAEPLIAAVVAEFPELARAKVRVRNSGWDSIALDVDDRMIFKFPRNAIAEVALRREAGLLAALRPRLKLAVPQMSLHHGPPIFSSHKKIKGEHLDPKDYARLDAKARDRLARDLAGFFATLHALDLDEMRGLGALPVPDEALASSVVALLPAALRPLAEALLAKALPSDPLGPVFGYFDGHGMNMAFDHKRGILNGIYDFADSGIGPLHCEFVQPGTLGADLSTRLIDAYEKITLRHLDRDRIRWVTGLHRLMKVAETAGDPQMRPRMIAGFADWVQGK